MRKLRIKIYQGAITDIRQAAEWYEEQSVGLGKRFKSEVKKQVNALAGSAFHHAVGYDDVRCLKIPKFPFNIHYTISNNEVIIFAVIHTSRNPEIWNTKKR